jgi:hypothetical protein
MRLAAEARAAQLVGDVIVLAGLTAIVTAGAAH